MTDMAPPPESRRRRWLFRAWIALTIAVAGYVALADPFALAGALPHSYLAYSVPPLMILLLGLSLAWLIALVSRRARPGRRPGAGPSG
ncbi:hypothetical protein SAMN06265365_10572 [Tistlia consotensis]|uniref:Uncharacterized protein n=1 Tax=Tistlia consotensis USBA 355 TaxID=560819 RepID=A0A1Y6BQ65_9PROT|nr:hypothetical protein [Tistlia consotensis]SMF14059.1 hypothetical protein SAMN05428998_105226 [Tistlia consotensis USBA 355]SNR49924.1 hypothetical protein SAMN06265365_10572 [Tistlia consotensis]